MAKAKKKRSKLVCPKTFRGKKVRSSKGTCHIVLASGKKRRVKKVAAKHSSHRSVKRSAKARGMTTRAYTRAYGSSPPERRMARQFMVDAGATHVISARMPGGSPVETMGFDQADSDRTAAEWRREGYTDVHVSRLRGRR